MGCRFRSRTQLAVGVGALVLLPAFGACNFVVDTTDSQCATDADCRALGADFNNTVCREQVCRSLLNADCTELMGAQPGQGVLLLGFMGPVRGEFQSVGLPVKRGAELALFQIDELSLERVSMLVCHSTDDPARVARHLIDVARVPAILGPTFSGVTIDTAPTTIDAGVLLMSASATSPAISGLDDDDLVWRTAPSDALQARPLAELTQRLEDELIAQGLDEPLRVAVTVKQDAYGLGLQNEVVDLLELNGMSAVAVGNQDHFRVISYEDPTTNPAVTFDDVVAELAEFEPHIVLGLGTNEVVTRVIVELEDLRPNPKPIYLLPDGGRISEVETITTGNPDLQSRILGTVPGDQDTPQYLSFASNFRTNFQSEPGAFAAHGYDATYLLTYASLLGSSTSGKGMAEGLRRTSCKGGVRTKPNDPTLQFDTAKAGGCVDYVGVSGELDFNEDGEASSAITVWCVSEKDGQARIVATPGYFDPLLGESGAFTEDFEITCPQQ